MEERPEGIKNLNTNVKKIDDELLKADAFGGISISVNDNLHTAEVNDPESLESATNQPVADKSLGTKLDRLVDLQLDASPIKSEVPGDASLQEMNATESIEAKQVQMSSGQPNDLKGIEDINAGEGLVDTVQVSVEVSQSVVSDTDEKTSNSESYESKPQAERQHKERENPNSADLKLDFSEAEVKSLDGVNADKEREQDKQRISTELSPYAPLLESKAVSSNEIDGGSQMQLPDSSKAEEDVHVGSLAKNLPALDNPKLLKDFKDDNKFKSSFPLDLGSSEEICSAKDDSVPASEVTKSFVDTGRSDGSISSVALDVSGDQVSEEKVAVSTECKTDSSGLASNPNDFECGVSNIPNSSGLQEPEDSSKNSLTSGTPADHSDMNTVISSYQEEAKQATKVDDPVIERTEEILVDTSCLSEANETMVTLGGSDHDEHEKVRTEHPIVAGGETEKERTEEKLAGVSEGDKTIYLFEGHNDRAIVTDTAVHESREEIFRKASEDSTISNDAKALESASATGLDSKVISDCDVKEPTGLLVDTDLNSRVVDNSHAGDGLKSATGVISSASQNEGDDKLIKQNNTVSAVDTAMTLSSRAGRLDADQGSFSVISTRHKSRVPNRIRKYHFLDKYAGLAKVENPLIEVPSPRLGPFPEGELIGPITPLPQPVLTAMTTADGVDVPQDVVTTSDGCNEFILIIRKPLNESDVKPDKGRFTIPKYQASRDNFLDEDEKNKLESDALEVTVKIVRGNFYLIEVKNYISGMSKDQMKVLSGKRWRALVDENQLKEGDMVELWRCSTIGRVVYVLKRVVR